MRYVIIGNSVAAAGCIAGIRQQDPQGEITVIGKEPYGAYSRPLISYLLQGKTDLVRMRYRPDAFYQEHGCVMRLGETASAIDPAQKQVRLEQGEVLPYDKLLVATGSRPFIPPTEGLEEVEQRFTFMTLDDALTLAQALTPQSRVLILGAGLIGLKCAEAIYEKTGNITVVDLAPRILSSVLDEAGATRMQRHLEGKGISFVLGDSVARFQGGRAKLQKGGELPFDILVEAVGVRPETGLVAQAGGKVERGIVTGLYGETSLPDVYAAGDCAQCHDVSSGTDRVLALLPNAYLQGHCAGVHMAGGDCAPRPLLPMNATGLLGLHMITAGSYQGQDLVMEDEVSYKRLFFEDDKLKGYILIGNVERAGIYTALIREGTPLSSIDFELIAKRPQLMAFQKADRMKKLGGIG